MKYNPTPVMQDASKTVTVQSSSGQNTKLQLNFLDAAGEANIHNLAHLFARDIQCGVLVFSIDSKHAFE